MQAPLLVGQVGGLTPVQVQTAFVFVLVGQVMFAQALRQMWPTWPHRVLLLLVVAAAALALLESLGVLRTELARLPRWTLRDGELANDRMALNTAVAFLSTSLALWNIGAVGSRLRLATGAAWVVLAIAGTAVVGYVLDVGLAVGWGSRLGMATPTAVALLAIGVGVLAACWSRSTRSASPPPWLSPAVGAMTFALALLVWRALIEFSVQVDDSVAVAATTLALTGRSRSTTSRQRASSSPRGRGVRRCIAGSRPSQMDRPLPHWRRRALVDHPWRRDASWSRPRTVVVSWTCA